MHHYSLTAVCVCVCVCSSTSCCGLQGPPMHHYSLTAMCMCACVCMCVWQFKLLWSPWANNSSLQLDSNVCVCVCVAVQVALVTMGHQLIPTAWQQCVRVCVCVCSSTSCSGHHGPPVHHYSLTANGCMCMYMCVCVCVLQCKFAVVTMGHQCITVSWQLYSVCCSLQWSLWATSISLYHDSCTVCVAVCRGHYGPPVHHYIMTAVLCVLQFAVVTMGHQYITISWQLCYVCCSLLWSLWATSTSLYHDSCAMCVAVCSGHYGPPVYHYIMTAVLCVLQYKFVIVTMGHQYITISWQLCYVCCSLQWSLWTTSTPLYHDSCAMCVAVQICYSHYCPPVHHYIMTAVLCVLQFAVVTMDHQYTTISWQLCYVCCSTSLLQSL